MEIGLQMQRKQFLSVKRNGMDLICKILIMRNGNRLSSHSIQFRWGI